MYLETKQTQLSRAVVLIMTKSVRDLQQSWVEYDGFDVGANTYFAMAALPELNSFVINGGRGGGEGFPVERRNVLFNASGDGSWDTNIPDGGNYIVYGYAELSTVQTYHTSTGLWNTRTTTGKTPSNRMDHTLTLNIVDTQIPVNDYFYTLDTETMNWSTRDLDVSDGGMSAGPRQGHSAVLVGTNLFIIFGSTGSTDAGLFVLDIECWSWIGSVNAVTYPPQELGEGNNSVRCNGGVTGGDGGATGSDVGYNAGTIAVYGVL
ncbi:hypothetical protein BJV82DRAFT_574220 [Fennellomyces sp. T-0311]|nr:hypothetical protein BJV82DRAFT_574220 [Fennellomyces sp. T-0311]